MNAPYPVITANGFAYFVTPAGQCAAVYTGGRLVDAKHFVGQVIDDKPQEPTPAEWAAMMERQNRQLNK